MPKGMMGFQKGHPAFTTKGHYKPGMIPWNKGRKCPERSGANHPSYKGGNISKDGFRRISVSGAVVLEHRHVMEQHLGRKLKQGEIVYHINNDLLDNKIENLKVIDRKTLLRMHPLPDRGGSVIKKCAFCSKEFKSHKVNHAKYCSYACWMKVHRTNKLWTCPVCGEQVYKVKNLEGLVKAGTELPASPGEERDDNQQRDHSVGGEAVTGAPEEEELEDQEDQERHSDEEASAVSIAGVGVSVGANLTVAVELVVPDDDEHSDDGEHDVEHIAAGIRVGSHVATVHTVDKQHTTDRDNNVGEPIVIHKARDTRGASTDVLLGISLGGGVEVEHHGEEHQTQDEVSPENSAAQLTHKAITGAGDNDNLRLRGGSPHGRGGCVCDLLNCGSRRRHLFI